MVTEDQVLRWLWPQPGSRLVNGRWLSNGDVVVNESWRKVLHRRARIVWQRYCSEPPVTVLEIAEQQQVSRGAVYAQLQRCLQILRRHWRLLRDELPTGHPLMLAALGESDPWASSRG